MDKRFQGAKFVAAASQYLGWLVIAVLLVNAVVTVFIADAPNATKAQALFYAAAGIIAGLGFILAGQLTLAQVVTAESCSSILEHLSKQPSRAPLEEPPNTGKEST